MHPTPNRTKAKWIAMLAVSLGVFMGTLDASIINVSLPTLVDELHTDFATIQWVILGYILVVTSMMLGAARLGDMLDKKKLYALGLGLFTLGSLACGFAPGVGWLIGFRVLQGCGAVITQALGAAIVVEVFPSRERGKAMGIIGGVVSVGLAMGPALGGVIIGLLSWRWVFWINVPIGIMAMAIVLRFVPPTTAHIPDQRFDGGGAAILFVSLGCYALAMTLGQHHGFQQASVLSLLGVAGIGLLGFLALERRLRQPMIDLTIFQNRLFSLNVLMSLLTFVVLGTSMLIIPFFLQYVMGLPTGRVGLLLMVIPVGMGLVAPLAGWLSDRHGPRGISLLGLCLITTGCLAASTLENSATALDYILRVGPIGIGIGMFQSPNNSAIMGAVPSQRLGIASGLMALSRNLGQTSGVPLGGAIFTAFALSLSGAQTLNITQAPVASLEAGMAGAFRISACLALGNAGLAGLAWWKARGDGPVLDE